MLNFFKPKENASSLKLSILRDGRTSIGVGISSKFSIPQFKYVRIAEDPKSKKFILFLSNERTGDCFKINKVGSQRWLDTSHVFDSLGIQYKNRKYNLSELVDCI